MDRVLPARLIWFARMTLFLTPSLQKQLSTNNVNLLNCQKKDKKQDGVHFVFSLKQVNKIEGVVLNRVCISGCCFCPITGQGPGSKVTLSCSSIPRASLVCTQIFIDFPFPPPGYNVTFSKVCLVGSVKVGKENFRCSSGLNYVDTFILISFVFYRELRYSTEQIRDSISSGFLSF